MNYLPNTECDTRPGAGDVRRRDRVSARTSTSSRRPWLSVEDDLLTELVAARVPTTAIGQALSRSVRSISARIHKRKLRRTERHRYPAALDEALLAGTSTKRALAKHYDLPESAITNRARKLGVRLNFPQRRGPLNPAHSPAATHDAALDHVRVDILLALLRRLRSGACRLPDLMTASGRSRAMTFRYLASIRALGLRIPCRRGEYRVADWGIVDPARL